MGSLDYHNSLPIDIKDVRNLIVVHAIASGIRGINPLMVILFNHALDVINHVFGRVVIKIKKELVVVIIQPDSCSVALYLV